MDPNEIKLESMDKLFEYEKHSRVIDNLSKDELRIFAKLYFKLYLKQQEVVHSLAKM
jgi:hypothetical protein